MQRFHNIKNFVLCGLLVYTSASSFSSNAAWEQPKLGHQMTEVSSPVPAIDFVLEDMDETPFSFSQLKGKVVLLNFWATWCPPCVREIPSMERLYQKFKNNNFTVLGLNQMEDGDTVFAFTGQLALDPTFTVLFDKTSKVSRLYKVNGLPTTYLIDKKGLIRYRAIGGREFDHPDIEKIIKQLLNE